MLNDDHQKNLDALLAASNRFAATAMAVKIVRELLKRGHPQAADVVLDFIDTEE